MTGADLTDEQRRALAEEILEVSKAFNDMYTRWLQEHATPLAIKVQEAGLDPRVVFEQAADTMVTLAGNIRNAVLTEVPQAPVPPLRVVKPRDRRE